MKSFSDPWKTEVRPALVKVAIAAPDEAGGDRSGRAAPVRSLISADRTSRPSSTASKLTAANAVLGQFLPLATGSFWSLKASPPQALVKAVALPFKGRRSRPFCRAQGIECVSGNALAKGVEVGFA
jgi:hypothetical protein